MHAITQSNIFTPAYMQLQQYKTSWGTRSHTEFANGHEYLLRINYEVNSTFLEFQRNCDFLLQAVFKNCVI